jgi:hypothetical protein
VAARLLRARARPWSLLATVCAIGCGGSTSSQANPSSTGGTGGQVVDSGTGGSTPTDSGTGGSALPDSGTIITGSACASAVECGAGYDCNLEAPGGYCMQGSPGGPTACHEPDAPCTAPGATCSPLPWHQIPGVCLETCTSAADCRSNYICALVELFPGDPSSPESPTKVCWTACQPGADQSCNDNPLISSTAYVRPTGPAPAVQALPRIQRRAAVSERETDDCASSVRPPAAAASHISGLLFGGSPRAQRCTLNSRNKSRRRIDWTARCCTPWFRRDRCPECKLAPSTCRSRSGNCSTPRRTRPNPRKLAPPACRASCSPDIRSATSCTQMIRWRQLRPPQSASSGTGPRTPAARHSRRRSPSVSTAGPRRLHCCKPGRDTGSPRTTRTAQSSRNRPRNPLARSPQFRCNRRCMPTRAPGSSRRRVRSNPRSSKS